MAVQTHGFKKGYMVRPSFILFVILTGCLLTGHSGYGQLSQEDSTASGDTSQKEIPGFVFRPTIGLGTGMFTFYGDVGRNHRFYHPTVSRVGYDLRVSNPLTEYLDLGFYVLRGKVGANERSLKRNLNFESQITTGGFNLSYNFDHFLKEDRVIDPFLSVGFESFEFLSKTDLYDENGNRYHYWSDGSIRSLPEDHPNAEQAKYLQRDYTYETDLRELDRDGFGDYPERSWAVPVSIGGELHLSKRVDMRISSTMHFTFTDLVDNVTHESVGDRQGNPQNDKFLFTSVSLHYDLQYLMEKEKKEPKPDKEIPLRELAFDGEDEDMDGVTDFLDDCAHTPNGVEVDMNGCPIDSDSDGVANYHDVDINTPKEELRRVDSTGEPYSDQELLDQYLAYVDSTGEYVDIKDTVYSQMTTTGFPKRKKKKRKVKLPRKSYMVRVGQSKEGISDSLREKLLSISDVRTIDKEDTTIYVVGDYKDLPNAVRRKFQLEAKGIDGDIISKKGKDIQKEEVTYASSEGGKGEKGATENIVFRVQLGAFKQELSRNIFNDVPSLLVIHGDDGITRYVTGSFDNIRDAARHKTEMYLKGYEDAFITAYKGGERILLSEAGAKVTGEEESFEEEEQKGGVNKELISFSIQLGAYEEDVPTRELEKFMTLKDVDPIEQGGITKYIHGEFDSFEEAKKALEELNQKGDYGDAFVVGKFKNEVITAAEARELLNR